MTNFDNSQSCDHERRMPTNLGNKEAGLDVRLKAVRHAAGLTQKELATALGVESITVSRWERGVTTPSLSRLQKIAEITQSTVSDLVRDSAAHTDYDAELEAVRRELAETKLLVARIARALERIRPTGPTLIGTRMSRGR